jgi:hypothetical protein
LKLFATTADLLIPELRTELISPPAYLLVWKQGDGFLLQGGIPPD